MSRRYVFAQGSQGDPRAGVQWPSNTPESYQQNPNTDNQWHQPNNYGNQNMAGLSADFVSPVFPWKNNNLMKSISHEGFEFPEYFQPTFSYCPANKKVLEDIVYPFGIIVQPTLAPDVPMIDCTASDVPRCRWCKAFYSDIGQHQYDVYSCGICGKKDAFTQSIHSFQQLIGQNNVYDIMPPEIYEDQINGGPLYAMIFDVSSEAISSGFTRQMMLTFKTTLEEMSDRAYIVLGTMSTNITLFNFETCGEIVITDVDHKIFLDMCIGRIGRYRKVLNRYMECLLERPGVSGGNCLGSAINLLSYILYDYGGVIIIGCFGMPSVGEGALQPRAVTSQTVEQDLLKTDTGDAGKYYKELIYECSRAYASVHLFCASLTDRSVDLATFSVVSGHTGGSVNVYSPFEGDMPETLHNDLFRVLTSNYYWNCAVRLRHSEGIRIRNVISNIYVTSRQEVRCCSLSSEHGCAFQLTVDDEVREAFFQLAVLWTGYNRKRYVRIFNFRLPVSSDPYQIVRSANQGALISLFSKIVTQDVLRDGVQAASKIVRDCISNAFSRKLIPESMPYLLHSLLSSGLLTSTHVNGIDGRVSYILKVRRFNTVDMVLELYPRFISLDYPDVCLPLENNSFTAGNIFLFHTPNVIYIYVSPESTSSELLDTFGVDDIDMLPKSVPTTDGQKNTILNELLEGCYNLSRRYLTNKIVTNSSPDVRVIGDLLVDEARGGQMNIQGFFSSLGLRV